MNGEGMYMMESCESEHCLKLHLAWVWRWRLHDTVGRLL